VPDCIESSANRVHKSSIGGATYQSIWLHRKRHQQQTHDRASAPGPWERQTRAGGPSEVLGGRPLLRFFILRNWPLVVEWSGVFVESEGLVRNDRLFIDCGSSLGRSVSPAPHRRNPLNPPSAIEPWHSQSEISRRGIARRSRACWVSLTGIRYFVDPLC